MGQPTKAFELVSTVLVQLEPVFYYQNIFFFLKRLRKEQRNSAEFPTEQKKFQP